jgi:hypothetical protein
MMFQLNFAHRLIWKRLHINLFQWEGHPVRFDMRLISKIKRQPHLKIRSREVLQQELQAIRLGN